VHARPYEKKLRKHKQKKWKTNVQKKKSTEVLLPTFLLEARKKNMKPVLKKKGVTKECLLEPLIFQVFYFCKSKIFVFWRHSPKQVALNVESKKMCRQAYSSSLSAFFFLFKLNFYS